METNSEDWREIRARADSIANAIFLVSGGAVSISIGVLLGSDTVQAVSASTKYVVVVAWALLFYSITAFLFVKGLLVVQAYKVLTESSNSARWLSATTYANWLLALSGLLSFVGGMATLVWAAAAILMHHP